MSITIRSDGKIIYDFKHLSEVEGLIGILMSAKFTGDRFADLVQSELLYRILNALSCEVARQKNADKYTYALNKGDAVVVLVEKKLKRVIRSIDIDISNNMEVEKFIERAFYPFTLSKDASEWIALKLKQHKRRIS